MAQEGLGGGGLGHLEARVGFARLAQGLLGHLEQVFENLDAVAGVRRTTDAHIDAGSAMVHGDGLRGYALLEPASQALRADDVRMDGHDDEAVVAVAAHDVVIAHDRLDAPRDGLQHAIGVVPTVGRPNGGKRLDIDEQQAQGVAVPFAPAPLGRKPLEHLHAVPDPSDGIDEGNLGEFELDLVEHATLGPQLGTGAFEVLAVGGNAVAQAADARDTTAVRREKAILDAERGPVGALVGHVNEDLVAPGGAHEFPKHALAGMERHGPHEIRARLGAAHAIEEGHVGVLERAVGAQQDHEIVGLAKQSVEGFGHDVHVHRGGGSTILRRTVRVHHRAYRASALRPAPRSPPQAERTRPRNRGQNLRMRLPRLLVHALLLGLVLRAVALGAHALWLDEGATWSWATRTTWAETIFAESNHPPVWWMVTRAWIGVFGDSAAALRAPAVVCGVLAIYLAWLLGTRLLDPRRLPRRGGFLAAPVRPRDAERTAALFAGCIALSPFLVEYAQEARMYALLIAEGLGLTLLYLAWLDDGRRRWLVGYALLAAAALHTHYFALWPILAHPLHALGVALADRRRRKRDPARPGPRFDARPIFVATLAAGLLFVPWFVYLLRNYEGISTGQAHEPFGRLAYVLWRMGAGPGLVVVDRARQAAGIEATIDEELVWIGLIGLLWFGVLTLGILALRDRPGTRSIVLVNVLAPIGFALLAHFAGYPLIHERYLCFLAPWLFLLAILGVREGPHTFRLAAAAALVLLLLAGTVAHQAAPIGLPGSGFAGRLDGERLPARFGAADEGALAVLHHGHPFGKEPWRHAEGFVRRRTSPEEGDLVILYPAYLHLVWDHYDRGRLPQIRLPKGTDSTQWAAALAADEAKLRQATRIALVLAHEETQDPDEVYRFVRGHIARLWSAEGLSRMEVVSPILFDRSWGVRVAFFNRRTRGPDQPEDNS